MKDLKALIEIFSYNVFHSWEKLLTPIDRGRSPCNELRASIHARRIPRLFLKAVIVAWHGLMGDYLMKRNSYKKGKEDFSDNTIDLRKGRGRPVKRRMFYFQDETGRVLFEIYGSGLAFTEKPHGKISMGRFQTITNLRNLQLSYDKINAMPAIAIFQGLHPTRRVLNIGEVSKLIAGLVKVYYILYKEIEKDAKRIGGKVEGLP